MHLIVDIGNSFIKLGIFQDDVLVHKHVCEKLYVKNLRSIHKEFPFTDVIISSVRKYNFYFIKYLERHYPVSYLTSRTKVPVKNLYKTPKTLGMDRLAVAVAAHAIYPKSNVLVVDIGTCMTFDYVDKKGVYHGGNISPGIELRLSAMHHFTSNLPLISRKVNEDILGKSTEEAMQNGVVRGISAEIDHFIIYLTKKMGKMKVVLTGGDAQYFGDLVESKIFVDSNLVLKGLNEILKFNKDT